MPLPQHVKLQLPVDIVEKIKKDSIMSDFESFVFSPDFQTVRLSIAGRAAALLGDPLLAYEIIRLGAVIDLADHEGQTPLLKATNALALCHISSAVESPCLSFAYAASGQSPRRAAPQETKRRNLLKRLHHVIKVLVEQHADVNCVVHGLSPLYGVCQACDWELVELLLRHGANPDAWAASAKAPASVFTTNQDKEKFRALRAK
ncbi:hypothetical protein HYDPIDRAFT_25357 [Hydnomerulius pinastri MD-312]|nr:hypothetical protein HYDPIDRAFT_25357 [Hydnomerulius pinastri MD-312]